MDSLFDYRPLMTLEDAQKLLSQNIKHGTHCLCCGRWAKINKANLNYSMVKVLCWLVGHHQLTNDWIHVPKQAEQDNASWVLQGNCIGKLKMWKMVKIMPNDSDPSKKRLGIYRPTEQGIAFAFNRISVPKAAYYFADTVLAYTKKTTTAAEACGSFFNHQKTMGDHLGDEPCFEV